MENSQQQDLLTDEVLYVRYGTFWPRFWAIFLDGLILAILAPITIYNRTEWKSFTLLFIVSFIQIVYKPFFEYKYGATPGKMALGLTVVNYEFGQASLEQIIIRNIFQILSGLIVLGLSIYTFSQADFYFASTSIEYSRIGYTAIATFMWQILMFAILLTDFIFLVSSDDSRCLHDRMGKTFVIKD